jgi:hypothetical protein
MVIVGKSRYYIPRVPGYPPPRPHPAEIGFLAPPYAVTGASEKDQLILENDSEFYDYNFFIFIIIIRLFIMIYIVRIRRHHQRTIIKIIRHKIIFALTLRGLGVGARNVRTTDITMIWRNHTVFFLVKLAPCFITHTLVELKSNKYIYF